MCYQCNTHPVYEFTNQRKLCKTCFIRYFQKKFLYIVKRFEMIKPGDSIGYKKESSSNSAVLENMLIMFSKKTNIKLIKLPNKKANKIAVDSSLDSESEGIINELINGDSSNLKKYLPVYQHNIKPLSLFLDEEIMLYAKLVNLKFNIKKDKKNKVESFIDNLEQKHPELKRAVVNSLLKLYE